MTGRKKPELACKEFALVLRGVHEGRPPIPFAKPINLLTGPPDENISGAASSETHVVILNVDEQLYIRDLTGLASLKVNGQTVADSRLRHGDHIELGRIEYEVFAPGLREHEGLPEEEVSAELRTAENSPPLRISAPVTVIGTNEHADVRLANKSAAHPLAMIVRLAGRFWLWDLQSPAMSMVDGRVVTRAALIDGCSLEVGNGVFTFHLASPASELEAEEAGAVPDELPAPAQKQSIPAPPASEDRADKGADRMKAGAPAPAMGAERFRHWGPLAFSVATVGQAEAFEGSAPVEASGAAMSTRSRRRRLRAWFIGAAIGLIGLAAAGIYAWRYWKH